MSESAEDNLAFLENSDADSFTLDYMIPKAVLD